MTLLQSQYDLSDNKVEQSFFCKYGSTALEKQSTFPMHTLKPDGFVIFMSISLTHLLFGDDDTAATLV